jgi:glycosyltransferase involved in cell wall biosynthesis
LRSVDADWVHVHYLTSHGTLAWLARLGWGLRARIAGSAWGTDILIAPELSPIHRWLTARVLRACSLTTSDSAHMTRRMIELGAGEVQTFPLGLDLLPPACGPKEPWLFFTNRALEPLYRPQQVLELFARIARDRPDARLVVANDGSIRPALEDLAYGLDCAARIRFVGRLDAAAQAEYYDRAQWFVSLPASDSVAVSVIEAMSHGAIPILSDLPANRELVRHGENGWIVKSAGDLAVAGLQPLLQQAPTIAAENREWVRRSALFGPCVERFVARLRSIAGEESS